MTEERILLVEDDLALARGLVDALVAEGWVVRHVPRGDLAEAEVDAFRPHLILLDIALPLRSGLDILRSLRERSWSGAVLMLTARSEVADRVVGLELGADDYLGKPFSLAELRARVRALLRRAPSHPESPTIETIEVGDVTFDFRSWTARGATGVSLDLTVRDVQVLKILAEAHGAAVDRLDIVEEVSGMDSAATARTVDNHVVALRRVLGDSRDRLQTVRGIGYRLITDRKPSD